MTPERGRPLAAALPALLLGFAVICACLLVGEVVARLARVPLPGSVIGMVVLFVLLRFVAGSRLERAVASASRLLLAVLPLLLVPAAVGIVLYLALLAGEALAVIVALIAGWIVTITVTALIAKYTFPRAGRESRSAKRMQQ